MGFFQISLHAKAVLSNNASLSVFQALNIGVTTYKVTIIGSGGSHVGTAGPQIFTQYGLFRFKISLLFYFDIQFCVHTTC